MADDTFNSGPSEGAEGSGGFLNPAAGAELYQAADAEGGINLSGLGRGDAGVGAPGGPPTDDFLEDAQAGAAAAQAESQRAAVRAAKDMETARLRLPYLATVLGFLKTFFVWLWKQFKAVPPVDDLFDRFIFSMGMQRKPGSMLRRAGHLAMQGRLTEAVKWYRDILALRPLSVAAYDGLGRAYFRLGLTEESSREFTIAENLDRLLHNRDDLEAAAALAQAFLDRKQAKIAVSMIEPVLISHFYAPNNSELLKTMGRVYAELRSNKKVYQVYAAGLAQHPEDPEYYLLKGAAEQKMGNAVEGERLAKWGRLMKKLKENPQDPNAKMAMGEIRLKEGMTEEGLKLLREAAALSPDNVGLRWRLFNLYQKQGQYEDSLKYFLEIVALDPENEDLQYRLADFYRKHKNREAAQPIYRALADKNPREPRPHALLGELLMEMGSFEEGQRLTELSQVLTYGLKENPDHRESLAFMKYLFSIGCHEEGRKWLDRALAKWPYHGELVLIKVKSLYNEYQYQEAATLLKRLISVKPDVAEPHIWVAMCYQRLGDNMAALAEAQLAARLAPKSYTAHKVLGDVLKEQKKLSQANAAYEVAEMMRLKAPK